MRVSWNLYKTIYKFREKNTVIKTVFTTNPDPHHCFLHCDLEALDLLLNFIGFIDSEIYDSFFHLILFMIAVHDSSNQLILSIAILIPRQKTVCSVKVVIFILAVLITIFWPYSWPFFFIFLHIINKTKGKLYKFFLLYSSKFRH